ncbi:uncharacterized protein LOC118348687 [Juglans regia]|uniref:Uncharacterized protein LOC118348687 n=1 Tax=Juglans regia TaxID=51240 RepID=A0A6P9EH60_JUGRE|nr:uncharacterized protein LOC118348687 [Juglans regia]
MMCNGEFLQKDPDEAIEYLNKLTEKAHTWTGLSATESTNGSRPTGNPNGGGIYHLREDDNLKAKVEMLTRELDVLKTKELKLTHVANHAKSFGPCFVCGGHGKFPSQTQSTPQGQHMTQGNLKEVNAIVTRSDKSLHIPTTNKSEDVEEEQSNDSAELPKKAKVIKSPVKVPFAQALKSNMRTLDSSNEILENLRQLGLGEIKPTSVVLQLANRLVKKSRGIVEDVFIQIDKFYYPVDFLIIDTSSDYCPHIWQPKFEELFKKNEEQIPSNVDSPKLELKPLPSGFKHAFLSRGDTFPESFAEALPVVEQPLLKIKDCKLENGWDVDLLERLMGTELAENVNNVLARTKEGEDLLIWTKTESGNFTTKSAWDCIRVRSPILEGHNWI